MEKKGSRSGQASSKGPATDSKKSLDNAGCKLWQRGGRRREAAGFSLSSKSDLPRKFKQNPARTSKSFDNKRPRAREAFNTAPAASGAETARLDNDLDAEMYSIFVPGSKKQSLNHLLNFNFSSYAGEPRRRQGKIAANKLMLTRKHKYNKEHFLQANCQFLVNSQGDYRPYLANPDALVDWNLIEQINLQVSDVASCPICLYPPMAAKMTRCGHIYCWSCILHYLSLSDKSSRKCPICDEAVHKADLKSVVSISHKTFNVNDVITFRLMKRQRGSLVAYPATADVRDDIILNMDEKQAQEVHSKLLLADQTQVLAIIEREENELKVQLMENSDCPENCFIDQALVLLNERKDKVLLSLDVVTDAKQKDLSLDLSLENLDVSDCQEAEENDEESKVNINPERAGISHNIANSQPAKFHYFYQASDGQHIYIHAINARMLEHSYGSLESSPNTLSGRILEKEGGSMTEELRKRLRYLQHLPVTCQFEVAEIQLRPPIIAADTLEFYNEQLEMRRRKRQKNAKEEKRREKQIADTENRLLGKYPIPELHLESQAQFPCFERTRSESEDNFPSDGNSSVSSSLNVENEYAGPSFAKMLASAKKKEIHSNGSRPLKESQEAALKMINVTGQKMSSTSLFSLRSNRSESDTEGGDFEPVPHNSSLGDAIVQALQKAEAEELEMLSPTEPDSPVNGKKKKKKNRQKILFTTNMAYFGK